MIRLLFTFLLATFLSPLAVAQTCNKDLALGKPVTTSSVQAGNIQTRATDGDPTSRWESAWNNNEWIMVDLGQNYPICTINLRWQVLATGYTVEVSPDGTSWTNIVTETANAGLNKTYSVTANGRYVRMTGLTRGSAYGFSLYDFEVIGTEPISYCSSTNVAQLRPTYVSSVSNGNAGNFAVDNNMGTRWESAHSDPQFIYVDLGANYDLCRVVLNWEAAYGSNYTIDISTNGSSWTTVKTVVGNYMRDNTIPITGNARYVRMSGTVRGSTYGYSLYEFSVYALLPAISVTKVTDAAEPSTGGSFRFSLPTAITFSEDITVNYSLSGTAVNGTDYTTLSGSVVIPAGQAGVNVPLSVINDQVIEGNETVIATVTSANSATHLGFPVSATDPSATMTIADDDNIPVNKIISIASLTNGAEPSTGGSYQFSLPAGITAAEDITVAFTKGGTATAGADYVNFGTAFTIPAGQNTAVRTLSVLDDKVIEITETAILTVTGGTTTTLGSFTASATNASASVDIADDDNINSNKIIRFALVSNAAEPATNGSFRIYLPTGITVFEDVTVNYTVDGTATPGVDYVALSGVATIPAGQNAGIVTITVIDDNDIEGNETVRSTVGSASSASFGSFLPAFGANAIVTITDDDDIAANRVLSVTKISDAVEGTSNGLFRISLPAGVTFPQNINVTFTIGGTAVAGTNYTSIPVTATIPAGQNSVTVQVTAQPYNNSILEGDKTVVLTLSGGTGASSGTFTTNPASNTATVIIADDENITANKQLDVNAGTSASEPSTAGNFIISLPGSLVAAEDIIVNYSITPYTGIGDGAAITGVDFVTLSGTATILAGQHSVSVNYTPIDDQIIETREAFNIELLGGSSATIGAFGVGKQYETGYINDNDNTPANKILSITRVSDASEPSTNGSFNISLPAGITASEDITINYTIGGTATSNSDYATLGTSIILPAGQNSVPLNVNVIDDNIIEGTETVVVTLTNGAGANLTSFTASAANGSATVDISDDDNTAANKEISIANANDGAEPAIDGAFTISLPAGITVNEPVTVNFNVSGTATANADYTSLGITATIPAGQNSVTLTVPVLDDNAIEETENVIVTVTGGAATSAGAFTAGSAYIATVSISDNDDIATNKEISIVATNDGSEPATNGVFTISLPTGVTIYEPVTVNFTVAGSATPNADYTALSTTTTIPAGQNSVTLTVPVLDDNIIEGNETVIITVTDGAATNTGAFTASTTNIATVNINDDDNSATNKEISIVAANDGSEPSTNGTFTISLPTGVTVNEPVTVNFTVAGSATANADYTALGLTTTIPTGQNSITLTVPVLDDNEIEGTETVIVTISGGSATGAGTFTGSTTNVATVNINDDDNTATNKEISIVAANDGAEPGTDASFSISLPTGVTVNEPVTVNLAVAGTATDGTDFSTLGTTAIIPAGQNSITLTVPVLDDNEIEGTETVLVIVTGGTATNAGIFTASTANNATVNISDDDNIATNKVISISATNDGAEPATDGAFTLSLPTGVTVNEPVTVNITVAGTATDGTDYTTLGTTATIPAGQNSVSMIVPVLDDNIIEGTETVIVTVTGGSATDAGIFTAGTSNSASIDISDDDNTATNKEISITNAGDGAEPAANGGFTVSLPTGVTVNEPVTMNFTVAGTATDGTDYTTVGTTATIPAGQNSIIVTVPVLDDNIIEGTETVIVTVTGGSATNAGAFTASATNEATVTISDDDDIATNKEISITATTQGAEPAANGEFTISLPTGITVNEPITVNFTVAGTATDAIDYTTLGTTAIIPAGQNSVTLTVPVLDDNIIEGTETVIATVTGGSATNTGAFTASTTNEATVNISDDDNIATNKEISITATTQGAEPATNGVFTISLPTGVTVNEPVTVNFTVAGTATDAIDYTTLGTTAIIPAGQNSITLTVPVLDDNIIEGTETAIVTLTGGSATNAGAFTASTTNVATVNISDDDNIAANKTISITKTADGAEPATNGEFVISLPTGVTASEDISVIYNIAGTATNATDYNTINGTISIPAGQNSVALPVTVISDNIIENTETVIVGIASGSGATLGAFTASISNNSATVLITDNNNTTVNKTISITATANGSEPASNGRFTISLPTGITASEDVTINYTVAGTATAGVDYTTLGTSITLPAGQNSVDIVVPVLNDQIIEGTETVIVTITNGTTISLGTFTASTTNATATVNISDDDNTTANKTISITNTTAGAEPSTNGGFTISLPTGVTVNEPVTVNFTVAGTATAGTDYTALGTTAIIPAGQNSVTLTVPVIDDQEIEATETIIVTVTGGSATNTGAFSASASNNTATVNISDDDNTPINKTISITNTTDGAEPSTNGVFTISLPTGVTVNEPVTVNFTVTGTATAGTDYTALGTTATIPAGQNSITLTVPVIDDQEIEATETIIVTVTGGSATNTGAFSASASNNTATVNISDDDNTTINKTISITSTTAGAEPSTNGVFTISLPTGVTVNEPVTVNFTVAGTATAGTDYTALGTTATIPAGQNSVTLSVPVIDDQEIEATETVIVNVTGGSATNTGAFSASASNNTATVNISDDDNTPINKTISITDTTDGAEPSTNGVFTISLPTGVTVNEPVTVNFTVAGTATAGTDYTALGNTATIPAGQNSITLTVPVLDDQEIEATETIIVTVTGGSATNTGVFTASTSNNTATVNISDDDNTSINKTISITNTTDGAEPSTNGVFTISLPTGVTVNEPVTVTFTVAGTATAGTDYTALGTTATIPAGQNSITLTVPVIDDQEIEATETVIVTVTGGSATNTGVFTASTSNNTATVNISDDDNTTINKTISITSTTDGAEPSTNGVFTISLPTGVTVNEPVTVTFTVAGTATAGTDYTALGTTATIPAGQNSITLTVPVIDDQEIEATETVIVTVTGGSATNTGAFSASASNNTATVNISDDDNTPINKTISITNTTDGAEPSTNGVFTISLPTGVTVNEPVTVNFTVNGTATAGTDYTALGTTATIPAGQNSITLTVPVLDDQEIEATETVIVTVTGGSATNTGAFSASASNNTATVNISDDDNTTINKTISITSTTDGAEPSTNGVFSISLPTGVTVNEPVTVNFTVNGTATAGTDYTALGTTATIPAGQNSITLTVPVLDDQEIEATETVIVTVTGGSATNTGAFSASTTNNTATVNISDDDNTPANKTISITPSNDGAEPSTNGAFTISLPTGVMVNEPVTVTYTVAGTATVGADYTMLTGSIDIPAGQNSVTLIVPVLDDQIIEATETVIVTLSGGNGATTGAYTNSTTNAAASLNITDDDNTPANTTISISNTNNGAEPATNGDFTISLPAGITATEDITVNYTVTGTATAGADYVALPGTIIIPAGQNSITQPVVVTDDLLMEGDETVILNLTGANGATLGTLTIGAATATITIADDENIPANKIISITKNTDAAEPATNGSFTVSLPTGISATEDVTVNYTISGTAIAGTDYTTLSGTVTIPAGQNNISIPVNVIDDQLVEGDETVTVSVTNATGTALGTFTISTTSNTASLIISDDDNTTVNRTISITKLNDAAEPSTTGNFSISLPAGITAIEDITVTYTITGTATPGTDYTGLPGTSIIPAGQNSVTVPVTVIDDQLTESTETVIVNLTGATATSPGTWTISTTNAQATVNISDDDNSAVQFETWKTATLPADNTDGKIGQGEEITYTIFVRNTGTVNISQLTILDPMPAYTTYVSGGALINNTVNFSVVDLQPNAIGQVSFIVRADNYLQGIPSITNVAQVSDGTTTKNTVACDPSDPNCNMGDQTLVTVREPLGDLVISKRALTPATNGEFYLLGESITYEIVVKNEGEKIFNNITITDSLPNALDMPTNYVTSRGTIISNPVARKVIGSVDQLFPGEEVTITLTCRINNKQIVNTAYVTADDTETDLTNNIAVTTAAASTRDLTFINAFRPGNNGVNDRFVIVGLEKYPGSKLLIYNRWGSLVYQSNDYKNDWRAIDMPMGGYIYVAEIKKPEGTVVYKGDFIIIK